LNNFTGSTSQITTDETIRYTNNLPANISIVNYSYLANGFLNSQSYISGSDTTIVEYTYSENAGITDALKTEVDVVVYPNPAQNDIHVKTVGDILSLSLVDISGRLIREVRGTSLMKIKDLPAGNYILTIETIKGSVAKKILKN
jgi:hypothetical protein